MNTKIMLATSLVANALLLGTNVYLLKQDPSELSYQQPLIICTSHNKAGAAEKPVATTALANEASEAFEWWRVDSKDYQQYLIKLRGLGYPDKTIQEIVAADVNELFSARVKGQVYSKR